MKKSNVVPLRTSLKPGTAPRQYVLSTKVQDPLIRYSERDFIEGPYRPCTRCKPMRLFTYLGIQTHKRWHAKQDAEFAARVFPKQRARK